MSGDWEKLSDEQRKDLDAFRAKISQHLIAECELFYKQHPELRLIWSFTSDALIRADHPTEYISL